MHYLFIQPEVHPLHMRAVLKIAVTCIFNKNTSFVTKQIVYCFKTWVNSCFFLPKYFEKWKKYANCLKFISINNWIRISTICFKIFCECCIILNWNEKQCINDVILWYFRVRHLLFSAMYIPNRGFPKLSR